MKPSHIVKKDKSIKIIKKGKKVYFSNFQKFVPKYLYEGNTLKYE